MHFNITSKLAIASLFFASLASAIDMCSNQLTGDSSTLQVSTYQSNGLCIDQCSGYAYAILLYKQCWCSNYTPSSSVSTSECNESCPGFPKDDCGNETKKLYAYILLNNPSGIAGGSSTASSSATKTSTQPTSTISSTTTSFSISSTSESTSLSSSSESTEFSSSSSSISSTDSASSSSSSSTTLSSKTSSDFFLSTITVTGTLQTLTVTRSTPLSTAAAGDATSTPTSVTLEPVDKSKSGGFFNNKGAVAGVFAVVGVVALLLIALIIYLLYRRNRQNQGKDLNQGFVNGKGSPNSFSYPSNMSGAGMTGAMGSDRGRTSPQSASGFGDLNEKGPVFDSHTLVPIEVDQRLDPSKVYMRWENNESRRSLQDEHDYSRKVLRVTNPDGSA